MKLMKVLRTVAFAIAVSAYAGIAHADSIGPDCGSCFGGIYTLTYDALSSTEYLITLTADLTNTTGGVTDVDAVAIKIASGGNSPYTAVTLQSAPAGWGTNAILSKGLSNNDCSTTDGSWLCSQATTPALVGSTLTWTFDVTLDAGSQLLLPPDLSSLKIDFNGCSNPGPNGCLLSEDIQLQAPDGGSTVALLGSVLLGLSMLRWRFGKS